MFPFPENVVNTENREIKVLAFSIERIACAYGLEEMNHLSLDSFLF